MRKIEAIGVMVLILLFTFTACTKQEEVHNMYIQEEVHNMYIEEASITDEEKQIIELLDVDENYAIYDFKVDEGIQAMQINVYELKDGKWSPISEGARVFKGTQGRLALQFDNIGMGVTTALQSEHEKGNDSYTVEPPENYEGMGQATSRLHSRTEVIYEKEIPLAIQILTAKNEVTSYNVEYFYSPEEYAKYDYEYVYAITVRFSQKTVSELNAEESNLQKKNTEETEKEVGVEQQQEKKEILTIEKLEELAEKGDQLSWQDFEQYESVDCGSGLYILRYALNEAYYFVIGGTSIDEKPMYMHLVEADNKENYIDIRNQSISEFLK